MRAAAILATVALVPLILTPNLQFYYDVTPKVAVLLLGASIALLLGPVNVRALWSRRSARWFLAIVAFQFLWLALATALSSNPVLSLNGTTWRRSGLIVQAGLLTFTLLCLTWLNEDTANLRRLQRIVAAVAALISMYTIAQYFGVDPLLKSSGYQAGEGPFTIVRPPATLGHADYAAAWLLFGAFCSPAWMLPLTAFAILLTGTRSALLGLAAGALLIGLARYRVATNRQRLAAAVTLILIVAFVLSPAGSKVRARVHWSVDDLRGGARLLLWRDSLPMVAQHPLIGLGPETFGLQFPLFESLDLARTYPDFYHESSHNLVLDVATGQGLPAAVAFLSLCMLGFLSGMRSHSPFAPGLMAGLAAMLMAHLFVVLTVPTELAVYLLIAMLVSLDRSSPVKQFSINTRPALMVLQFALAAVFIVFTVGSVAADYLLARAQERIAAGDAGAAAKAYRDSLPWQPAGTGADLSYSRQMAALAARSTIFRTSIDASLEALQSGIRATEQSDQRQNAWYNLAQIFAMRNDAASTERCLRNAIAWSPNWFKPHWALAQLLERQHRSREALVEAQAAVERDGNHDIEVSQTWTRIRTENPGP